MKPGQWKRSSRVYLDTLLVKMLRSFCLILSTLIFTLTILPLLVTVVVIPLAVWRLFLSRVLIKLLKPNFLRVTSLNGYPFAVDELYDKPRCTFLSVCHFSGPLTFGLIRKRFEDLMSSGKRPELQCLVTRWLGNIFLDKNCTFQLEKHIFLHEEIIKDPKEFDDAMNKFVSMAWERNKPLWEVHVFPNNKNPSLGIEASIIYRVHHSLMDGLSGHIVASDLMDPDPQHLEEVESFVKKLETKYKPSLLQKILAFFYLLLIAPFTSTYKLLSATETNFWTLKNKEQNGEMSQYISINELDLKWLKEVGKKVGANVTSLLVEAFTAATRNHFLEKAGGKKEMQDIHAVYVIPAPGHPGAHKLTNYFYPEVLTLPISQSKRGKRLDSIHSQFRTIMTTPQPFATYVFSLMASLICGAMNRCVPQFGGHFCTLAYSNILIYGRPYKCCGAESKFVIPVMGTFTKDNGITVVALSYNGKVGLFLRADKNIFPNDQSCERFVESVVKELKDMDEGEGMTGVREIVVKQ